MSISREDGPLKWNLNSALAVGGFALTILLQVIGGTVIWTNQSNDVQYLTEQVTDLKLKVAEIVPLTYQVTTALSNSSENKKAIENTNNRMDKVIENIGTKVDNITDSLNVLAKNVAVLSAQTEKQLNQKTDYRMPILIPK